MSYFVSQAEGNAPDTLGCAWLVYFAVQRQQLSVAPVTQLQQRVFIYSFTSLLMVQGYLQPPLHDLQDQKVCINHTGKHHNQKLTSRWIACMQQMTVWGKTMLHVNPGKALPF